MSAEGDPIASTLVMLASTEPGSDVAAVSSMAGFAGRRFIFFFRPDTAAASAPPQVHLIPCFATPCLIVGNGCASVFNTMSSRDKVDSSADNKNKYLSVSAAKNEGIS